MCLHIYFHSSPYSCTTHWTVIYPFQYPDIYSTVLLPFSPASPISLLELLSFVINGIGASFRGRHRTLNICYLGLLLNVILLKHPHILHSTELCLNIFTYKTPSNKSSKHSKFSTARLSFHVHRCLNLMYGKVWCTCRYISLYSLDMFSFLPIFHTSSGPPPLCLLSSFSLSALRPGPCMSLAHIHIDSGTSVIS